MIFDKNKDEIRALSLKEPYASLMLYDKIETRPRITNYRGWVLICASKVPYSDEDIRRISGAEDYHRIYVTLDYYLDNHITDNLGKAIAVGYLSECRLMQEADSKKSFVKFNRGIYCYVFEHVQPIKPFNWQGSQGWKTLTSEQRQLIELTPTFERFAVAATTKLLTKEEILENTTCCTIDEDADIDDVNNYYYQHEDVLKAMDKYANQFKP